jgi:hypothetical protein
MFFIYEITGQPKQKIAGLPAVADQYWSATVANVFNLEQLQKLGLKQVTDGDVLDYFFDPATLTELESAVQTQLQVSQIGDEGYVD